MTSIHKLSNFQKVQEFNRAFDMAPKEPATYLSGYTDELGSFQIDEYQHIRPEIFNNPKTVRLRLDLIDEEIEELSHAIEINDFIETRDAIADILYVAYGMADVLGINIDTVFKQNIKNIEMSRYDNNDNNDNDNDIRNKMFMSIGKYANHDNKNDNPIGLTNFDWIKVIYDNIVQPTTSLFKSISYTYKELETICLAVDSKNVGKESFVKIGNCIYNLLKYVYTYAYIVGIDANSDFAIVHTSNMSKLCDTEEDARNTVTDYKDKFESGTSPYDSPYYYELPSIGKWIVKNKSTGKALKNIKYKKVKFD
jgi:predicted HAD superfamily Cof-like phosphohydrolase